MTEILKSVLFGLVEGVTEWLPISSTGHMLLLEEVLPFSEAVVRKEFMELFLVVVQLGAIMAVVVMYWERLCPFDFKKGGKHGWIKKDVWTMWLKVAVACVPVVIIEFWAGDEIGQRFYRYEIVAVMLVLFGILFLLVERWNEQRAPRVCSVAQLSVRAAFVIGLFQVIAAVFPGTSRSGATILGALLIGISRETAAEFTFFLAVPVMLGASLLKLVKFGVIFEAQELSILLVGIVTAFVVSVGVIKFLMEYIKRHDFRLFGYYRIVLGILVFLVL